MASIIDDLQKPNSLPDPTETVFFIQTHISMVFVADNFVYKVKKPVDFGFLDFSTIEKRKHFCNQEIVLNSRFSNSIYLSVLPVRFNGKVHFLGEGRGEVVDYAVKMKRIPDFALMKSFFERDELNEGHLGAIARAIAGFHEKALQSKEIDNFGDPDVFKFTTDENFEQTEKYIGITISGNSYNILKQWTDRFFQKNRDLFYKRISLKRIKDCHGDLHMEHICLSDPVSMIDCIEFNDRLRYTDTLADIGFLLMDLEYRGGKGFADVLWEKYSRIAKEDRMEPMLTFYKIYRAYVRGKINSFQVDDLQITMDKKEIANNTAKKYFKLALGYIQ
ncbi:gluconokinase [Thermodesulfobacteriota bacterium]